ncbi:MAG: VOC family protein [Phycisphaerales bacterium]|nr:VOC family protein [Phycisphaerales bacterium]
MSDPRPVVYFEIPATDLDRAIEFYGSLFEVTIERTTIDGHPMGLLPEVEEGLGISGAIATGDSYRPSLDGTRIYFKVADLRATLARAIRLGAHELYPVTEVAPGTLVAEFQDPEGNRIALIERAGAER